MSNIATKDKVTILGAGWLGVPLSVSLLQSGSEVIATKQSTESLDQLQTQLSNNGLSSTALSLHLFSDELLKKNALTPEQLQTLFHQRKVIITIPPTPFIGQYSKTEETQGITDYLSFIQDVRQQAEKYNALEMIYTSSTSVYGNSSGIIHEALPAMPQTTNAKAIRQVEKSLQKSHLPITILRLGGLIGHGRHPIFSLQGRDNIRSPLNAINLLHIQDLIRAIQVILSRDKQANEHHIYNLVAPMHPNRQSYYQTLAKKLSLPLPRFATAQPELKRIIDGEKITEKGDFNYEIVDLLQAPLAKII